jgi:predicted transcriptional regulator of viral defense system
MSFPNRLSLSDMYLANKIYAPSYVSLETALSHYSLIPEVAIAVTSITSKPTRQFKNSHGLFIYRSIQPKAFCGYTIENHNGFDVLIAEPEKALLDMLYFKTLRTAAFDVESLRLDKKRVSRLNRKKVNMYSLIYGMDAGDILHAYI